MVYGLHVLLAVMQCYLCFLCETDVAWLLHRSGCADCSAESPKPSHARCLCNKLACAQVT